MSGAVCIVTALKAEAHPLIDHFRLTRETDDGLQFPVYSNGKIRLFVSGVGKRNCAAAVQCYGALHASKQAMAWLNVGIGGHGTRSIGEGLMANRIDDRTSGEIWYPSFVSDFRCDVGTVATTDEVETNFADDAVYEMEAAGFYGAARQHTRLDLIHSYKVISDNKLSSAMNLTRQEISRLVGTHGPCVASICSMLSNLVSELDSRHRTAREYDKFLARWRFSETQKHLLRRWLRKCETLGIQISVEDEKLSSCETSRSAIAVLHDELTDYWNRTRV